MNIFITCIAAVFVLFLPGFIWSFVFFEKRKIDSIERLALSFALSIALVPLVVFYTNLLGIKITTVTVIIQIILVILIALAIILFKEFRKRK
jgi:uncharacterized membrane protein